MLSAVLFCSIISYVCMKFLNSQDKSVIRSRSQITWNYPLYETFWSSVMLDELRRQSLATSHKGGKTFLRCDAKIWIFSSYEMKCDAEQFGHPLLRNNPSTSRLYGSCFEISLQIIAVVKFEKKKYFQFNRLFRTYLPITMLRRLKKDQSIND